MKKRLAIGALLVAVPLLAIGALPYSFQSGQVISAAEINSNFAYLNSRIEAMTSSSTGSFVSKIANYTGIMNHLVVSNSSADPLEIVEAISSQSNPSWVVKCGSGQELKSHKVPRFVAPGCSFYAYPDTANGMQAGDSYQVTYRK